MNFFPSAAVIVACTVLATRVIAQEPADCPAAVAAVAGLARPDVLSDSSASFRRLFACPQSGPPQIARLWSLSLLSQPETEVLRYRSRYLLDTRVLSTLISVARNGSRESHARQSAAAATLTYVDRDAATDLPALRRAARQNATVIASSGAGDILVGSSAPSAASSADVARLMSDLASQVSDLALQEIGIAGLQVVSARAPDAVTLPTTAVTLTYICGNKFRLRNKAFLNLTLRYDVYGTPESETLPIEMPESGSTQRDIFFTTRVKGTVRVFYRAKLLQTKANGNTPCSS
jgi:hypothetical protein